VATILKYIAEQTQVVGCKRKATRFPQLAAAGQYKPPVNELTMSLTDDLAIVDVWAGSAELRMPEVQGEEMHLIAPLRVGRGYRQRD
jgi:hypothetical protein